MCEIQNWLRDNEILTVGELRYRRTGSKRHPAHQLNAWYNWPDKTLYDILTRKEYLGHTITAKTHKVSYKSKRPGRTKKNNAISSQTPMSRLLTRKPLNLRKSGLLPATARQKQRRLIFFRLAVLRWLQT